MEKGEHEREPKEEKKKAVQEGARTGVENKVGEEKDIKGGSRVGTGTGAV